MCPAPPAARRAVQEAGQHEAQVRQAVQVVQHGGIHCFLARQRHHGPFRPAGDGTGHVGVGGGRTAAGQDEFPQRAQVGVVVRQGLVQAQHVLVPHRRPARDAEFSAQVEQIVLDAVQQRIDLGGRGRRAPQPDGAVQFVHVAQCGNARSVLGHAGLVAQAGGAVIAGAGGYDGDADRHGGLPMVDGGKGGQSCAARLRRASPVTRTTRHSSRISAPWCL